MKPLKKAKNFKGPQGPVVLAILDGVGVGTCAEGDVVSRANTPTLDWLAENALAAKLKAHGIAVGMPSDADMGNSEIGHNAIGCGRVFAQGAKLVNESIVDVATKKNTIALLFKGDWLSRNPLTEADLKTEMDYLSVTDYKLKFDVAQKDKQ